MTKQVNVDNVIDAYNNDNYDPLGSYTGTPINDSEKPIQDADDL